MERYIIEQRVKVIQAYYENGRSNQNAFGALRDFFDQHFHLSGFANKQNCRIWANYDPRVIVEKPMHPQRVTVWCGLWTGGIIELEDMDVDDMWFQKAGATCHTANETMALLRDKFNGRVISRGGDVNWPPRSCNLTPLDFFLWGYLNEKSYVDNSAH